MILYIFLILDILFASFNSTVDTSIFRLIQYQIRMNVTPLYWFFRLLRVAQFSWNLFVNAFAWATVVLWRYDAFATSSSLKLLWEMIFLLFPCGPHSWQYSWGLRLGLHAIVQTSLWSVRTTQLSLSITELNICRWVTLCRGACMLGLYSRSKSEEPYGNSVKALKLELSTTIVPPAKHQQISCFSPPVREVDGSSLVLNNRFKWHHVLLNVWHEQIECF